MGQVGQRMEKATKETITEEIIVSPKELVDEVKEEVKKPLLGSARNCVNWQPYGNAPASDRAPPDQRLWTLALPRCTARSSKR